MVRLLFIVWLRTNLNERVVQNKTTTKETAAQKQSAASVFCDIVHCRGGFFSGWY